LIAALIPGASPNLAQDNTLDTDNSDGIIQELREIKKLLEKESSPSSWSSMLEAILTLSGIAATVTIAYLFFLLDQGARRKNIVRRSCETLLRELGQAIESFQSADKRIHGSYYRVTTRRSYNSRH